MIRFNVASGSLTPLLTEDASEEEKQVAAEIAQNMNAVTNSNSNYKLLLDSLDKSFQSKNIDYKNYIDNGTISDIENFYTSAKGIEPWDSSKQGTALENFDPKFYAGLVPQKVQEWKDASKEITFGGKQIANVDITKKYPTLDSYLHSDYTFVGSPAGLPGKQKSFDVYQETTRAPTDREQQILRDVLLGTSKQAPQSLADLAAQNYVDVQGEKTFGALAKDALIEATNEYKNAIKKEQLMGTLQGMGFTSVTDLKQNIKDSLLGDLGAGGFLGAGISKQLDKTLGTNSSVAYNWQKWFDESLAKKYQDLKEIQDPEDANKKYAVDKSFADKFVNDYLRPRFDTSKSIAEFISYMNVKEEDQNILQTQLVSSSLKDFANKQTQEYIDSLKTKATNRNFDSNFYMNPELITGTDNTAKQSLYTQQKEDVQNAWNTRNNSDVIADGKTWSQLAYEYGANLENPDDFARLHYQVIGKDKGYDPAADTYTRQDLAKFITTDLANALQSEKASFSNPVFRDFVSAQSKAQEYVSKLNLTDLPTDVQAKLKDFGLDAKQSPAEEVKNALVSIFSTDPALEIRQKIDELNQQNITPTQEKLGYGYIQRASDAKATSTTPGSNTLFSIFKKAGYSGSEQDFYKEFLPDVSEEEKTLTGTSQSSTGVKTTKDKMQSMLGFTMPDFSNPMSAISSLNTMLESSDAKSTKAETYTPTKSSYFKYFQDEEDAGAPSYFKMGSSNANSLFSL